MMYLIDLAPDTDGRLLATCRTFPELTTFGKDKDEAPQSVVGALEEAIAARIADGDRVRRKSGVYLSERLLVIGRDCAAHLK